MGKTALVTGADGFVGRHVYGRLLKDGWDVTGIDVKSGIDCRDVFRFDTHRYDLVVHLAAVVGGRMTIDHEPMSVATDLAIDSDFFQYVLRSRPHRAVYFSSSAAYPIEWQNPSLWASGAMMAVPLREDMISTARAAEPDAIYGWVKLTGERLARHANEMGAGVYVFRPFSGYGADQDMTYPFPAFVQRAKSRLARFPIWGTGEQVRDWVHIDDVVNAMMTTLEWDPTVATPLNICTGVGTSFLELADLFMRTAGYEGKPNPIPDSPVGVMHRVGNPTNLHKIYKPAITIEEGIARALHGS